MLIMVGAALLVLVLTAYSVPISSRAAEPLSRHRGQLDAAQDGKPVSEARGRASRVKVEAYIESLCPDCANFVYHRLYKEVYKGGLWSIADVEFISWGNVAMRDGKPACQHGAIECHMNTVFSCAKHIGTGDQWFMFPVCFYEGLLQGVQRTQLYGLAEKCADSVGLSWAELTDCASGTTGQELSEAARARTDALRPRHTWVPWVLLDGGPINADSLRSADRIAALVCDAYEGPRPSACSSSGTL